MVPSLDAKWKFLPILAFKIVFAVSYLIIPFMNFGEFEGFTHIKQTAFNLNFIMACANLVLCILVSKKFKAFSLQWFES